MWPDLYKNAIKTDKLILGSVVSEKEESHWYASEDDQKPLGKQPEFQPYYQTRVNE